MLRGTTIQAVVRTGASRRIIGVTRGTIDTLAGATIYASMLGRFECVTDPIAVRDPLS